MSILMDHYPQHWLHRILEINSHNPPISTVPLKVIITFAFGQFSWAIINASSRGRLFRLAQLLFYPWPWNSGSWRKKNIKIYTFPTYVKWKPPAPDSIMLNTDVIFKSGYDRATIGRVFRNHSGAWLLGFINRICTNDYLETETHALLLGLSIALNTSFNLQK